MMALRVRCDMCGERVPLSRLVEGAQVCLACADRYRIPKGKPVTEGEFRRFRGKTQDASGDVPRRAGDEEAGEDAGAPSSRGGG